jgi:L-asparagine transporter-like permease
MLLVYLGIYTFCLVVVWALFIVSRMHSYKFKNFSHNIVKVTNILFTVLLLLSILWYVFIFMNYDAGQTIQLDFSSEKTFKEIDY